MPPCRQASSVKVAGSPSWSRIAWTIFCIPLKENGFVMPSRTCLRIIGAARKFRKYRLCILIKSDEPTLGFLLQRVPDHCARLMVLYLDRVRPLLAAVVGPTQIACQDIFWSLEPFKADDGGGAASGC